MSEPEAEPSAPHPLDGVPYLDGLGLTGPERQEWESRKRGTRVAIVLALDSGRFVVADAWASARAAVEERGLVEAIRAVRDGTAGDDYVPPGARAPEAKPASTEASAEDLGL